MNRRDALTTISMAGGASLIPSAETLAGTLSSEASATFQQAVKGTGPVKIRDIKTILTAPNRIRLVVVKVETTEPGLVGWGCATFTQRAIVVQTVLASVLVLLGRFDQIVAYFIFTMVLFLAMSVAGLFRLRRRGGTPAYRTPAFPLPALGFLLMTAVVLLLLAAGRPLQAALGLAMTALGVPVYAWLSTR